MQVQVLNPGSGFGSNCYLLTDSGHAAVVDPSAPSASILAAVRTANCTLDAVYLTHGHFDHILSVDTLRTACHGLPVYVHPADAPMMTDGEKNAFTVFFGQDRRFGPADRYLEEGQTLPLGQSSLTVLHTPGHSPGSVCFLNLADGFLLTGDTLFSKDVGRCDLWGGEYAALRASLRRLKELAPTLTIYPGHGESANLETALSYALNY
jgi:glyoxylase-like metal-dependent hydrolase (beta-lactamase superfamily II)